MPGLVVDRYGDYLVVQTLSQGMDRRAGLITELLVELLAPQGILARNDPKVRRLEGLDERVEVLYGEIPPTVLIREGAVTVQMDLWHGQKTGLFLDQRENHAAAAAVAHGRALDAFTYHGGFALQMAPRCESVLALDSSAAAVEATRGNAARNGLTNIDVREANVFDELRELEIAGESFDTIVLDPPAFAKNKGAVERATAGYKEINLRALKLLKPGGVLVTCSCSYHVGEIAFLTSSRRPRAMRNDRRDRQKRMQSRDHPVLLAVPETHYLKCMSSGDRCLDAPLARTGLVEQWELARLVPSATRARRHRMIRRVIQPASLLLALSAHCSRLRGRTTVGRLRGGVSVDPDQAFFGGHVETRPLIDNLTSGRTSSSALATT